MKLRTAILYTAPMRPIHRAGHNLRHAAPVALCLLMAACGQTGPLYLVMPANKFPPVTQHPMPTVSGTAPTTAPCVEVPTPTSNVAPVAAPFPGTVVEDVPYKASITPPSPAPASLTAILPACVIYPTRRAHAPAAATQAAPTAATHPHP